MRLGQQMIDMIDSNGERFQVDAALRVVTKEFGVGYLVGNAHTFRGLFHVYFPDEGDSFGTSLDQIESMTDEAAIWITGFLQGSAPELYEYLGAVVEETLEEIERWRAFCARFVRTGLCPPLPARPVGRLPITAEQRAQLAQRPWSWAGERVWVESGDSWTQADPQPPVDEWGTATGSRCDVRGEHAELDGLPAEWSVCGDCGVVEFEPGAQWMSPR